MNCGLSEKTVFITGAAQGLGLGISKVFLENGANVVLADISESVKETAKSLDAEGTRTLSIVLDVQDESAFQQAFDTAVERFGSVDFMVNNAALTVMRSVWDIDGAEWDKVLSTNLKSVFFGCRIAGLHMKKQGQGRIINIASLAGQQPSAIAGAHYAASKAGVISLTKSFAQELAGSAVTVNAVSPAAVEIPMFDSIPAEKLEALKKQIPVGRFGNAEEIGHAVAYLASNVTGYMTGNVLDLNGGRFMR